MDSEKVLVIVLLVICWVALIIDDICLNLEIRKNYKRPKTDKKPK